MLHYVVCTQPADVLTAAALNYYAMKSDLINRIIRCAQILEGKHRSGKIGAISYPAVQDCVRSPIFENLRMRRNRDFRCVIHNVLAISLYLKQF